jgi:hypothetical protein
MATSSATGCWIDDPFSVEWQKVAEISKGKTKTELLSIIVDKIGFVLVHPEQEESTLVIIDECLKNNFILHWVKSKGVSDLDELRVAWLDAMLSRVYQCESSLTIPLRYIKFDWIGILYEYLNNKKVQVLLHESDFRINDTRHDKYSGHATEYVHVLSLKKYGSRLCKVLRKMKENDLIKEVDHGIATLYTYFDIKYNIVDSDTGFEDLNLQHLQLTLKLLQELSMKLDDNEIKEWETKNGNQCCRRGSDKSHSA